MSLVQHCRKFVAIASLAFVTASHAVAGPYTGLYIFGDSLSDSGNAALAGVINAGQSVTSNAYVPSAAYASGTFSNGPVWSTQFATLLGLPLTPSIAGGTNYAIGGAKTSGGTPFTSLVTQVGSTVPGPASPFGSLLSPTNASVPSGALYVIAGGGNNARDAFSAVLASPANSASIISAAASQYASDVLGMVHTLKNAGAQSIIVWNTPNIGLTPLATTLNGLVNPLASTYASATATALNNALGSALAGESGVQIFDTYGFLTNTVVGVLTTPGGYNGLNNALGACGFVGGCGSSIFYDGIHPTTYAHSLLAQQMFALAVPVPEPAEYALMLLGLAVVAGAARRRARA
jgi:outer membrane lipase/esterase